MAKSCLNCKFEPDWIDLCGGEYAASYGECKYIVGQIVLPACISDHVRIKKHLVCRYKDNSGIHLNCKAWEPKDITEEKG